ncbi:hypothetical protein [Streptomyces griseoflavus]|uniref:hypothetical protein n=1 Tax=Streptomyces griseoflavus TaxID=35619 RepID=UPI0001B4DBFA|nr:hypothetical protein [Streptomyces griseoflavus]
MADKVGEQLMARLHAGTSPSRFEEREPEADETTHALWEQAGYPGGPAAIRKNQAAIRQEQQKAEREFDARVQERAKKLREEGVVLPEVAARNQLQAEQAEAREKAERRKAYEQMRANNLSEYAARSTEALRKADEQARAERKKRAEERAARRIASILAELRGEAG